MGIKIKVDGINFTFNSIKEAEDFVKPYEKADNRVVKIFKLENCKIKN